MRTWLILAIAAVGALVVGLLPTCLYLYVEPRGRPLWAKDGDRPSTRRAPAPVRITAWFSFLLGELAVAWLAIPVVCGALLYLQARLGHYKPVDLASTATVGVVAVAQAALALRLIPLGVRLLMRDEPACGRAAGRARFHGLANASMLGTVAALSWAMATIPGFVHPWLAVALSWAVVKPVMIYGVACLLHALLFGWCVRAFERSSPPV